MELPQTLHAQLYLLAYDRNRRRFQFGRDNTRWLFSFALRSAMLTDLFLTGYVEDEDGKAHRTRAAHPDDPVLQDALNGVEGRDWRKLIVRDGRYVRKAVRDQLEAAGWVHGQQRKLLGVVPANERLYDEDMVSALTSRVTGALRNAIDDRPADPRPLALGLIAVQAQMPVVFEFTENPRHRACVHEMTFAAIEPILGLHHAIHNEYANVRSDLTGRWGDGGCGGGV